MTGFSATDAAFEGFRIAREKPKVLLAWAGFSFLVSICSAVYLISIGEDARAVLDASASQQAADPQALLAMLGDLAPMMVMGLLVQCIMAAAVYRILLHPTDKGLAYLKVSMDEARLALLTFIYVFIAVAMLVAVVLAGTLIGMIASAAGPSVAVLVGGAAELFFLGLLFFAAVRLSLAPAITFAENRLAIFDSWALTRGHFWRLTGAYLLAIAAITVVALLVLVIFVVVAAIALGGDLQAAGKMFAPDQSSLATYFSPAMIAYLLVAAWLSALYYAVMIAPAAVAYRELSKHEPAV